MNNRITYLKTLHMALQLPLRYVKKTDCFLLPDNALLKKLSYFDTELLKQNQPFSYLSTEHFLLYGSICDPAYDARLFIGPVSTVPLQRSDIPALRRELFISAEEEEALWTLLHDADQVSMMQFFGVIALIYREFSGRVILPEEILASFQIQDPENFQTRQEAYFYDSLEAEVFHNTYQFEQTFLHYVEDGNVPALDQLFHHTPSLSIGQIGNTTLRQEQNILISTLTLLTRHAIRGGLDIETAYQLSDLYIQQSEKALDIATVRQLSYDAAMDFARRVAARKIPKGMSQEIYDCIQYITTHVNAPVNVDDVADAINRSRSYVSKHFKQELGFNLSDYIMHRKLEEAKSLLVYSDKPISEISSYLCFSSQSYFQTVFKKNYGMTPYHYRKKMREH